MDEITAKMFADAIAVGKDAIKVIETRTKINPAAMKHLVALFPALELIHENFLAEKDPEKRTELARSGKKICTIIKERIAEVRQEMARCQ